MIGITIFSLIFTLFVFTPLTIFQGYLLYKHVKANDLMWFLFWFNATIGLIMQITMKLIEMASKNKEEK